MPTLRHVALVATVAVAGSAMAPAPRHAPGRTATAPIGTAPAAVVTLSVDGRASANPSIAAEGRFVAVTWSAASTNAMDIYVATSRDGGRTFSAPAQVNAVAGDARVSGEEPPRIALLPRKSGTPEIVVVWTAKTGANWRLLSARSTDGGRTFGASANVPGSEAEGSRGWQSVAVDASGHVNVLWLDHRGLVAADGAHKHEMAPGQTMPAMPKADPTARAGLSALYFSSLDRSDAVRITNSVCYCCKTSLVTAGSNVYAVWRHVYPGSVRDMAFAVSRDRGRTFSAPVRISEDHWQIDGCPDNGPALAVDDKQQVHVVWPTSQDGTNAAALAIFYAVSRDGRTFTPRTQIPTRGAASHPQIALDSDGSTIVTWDEVVDGTRRLGMTRVRVDAAGKATFSAIAPPDAGPGQWYPVLASTSAGAWTAWVRQAEKGSVIGVASLR